MNPLELVRPEVRTLKPYTISHTTARVKLDANESPYGAPPEIAAEIAAELGKIDLNRYPDPEATRLKERISDLIGLAPDGMMLGNGSDELISYLITTFTGRGKGVLFPTPTFAMYGITAAALGQPAIEVPLNEEFQIEPERFVSAIRTQSPQIVFLATPNNPTGNSFHKDCVQQIIEESESIVVIDEAYIDYSSDPGFLPSLQSCPNLVILRTLSKIGMAALRIGILIASPTLLRELEKVRLPYNINTFSQAMASVILDHQELLSDQVRKIISGRERLLKAMAAIPQIQVFPSSANFILFRTALADELYQELYGAGVLIRNLNQPGALQGCLRVTVGRPDENTEFLAHLEKFYSEGK
jgi:histidinol-phosphate aminotransferase